MYQRTSQAEAQQAAAAGGGGPSVSGSEDEGEVVEGEIVDEGGGSQ
jgi:hypothetical protein